MAEFGIKLDISPESNPDIIADAHWLPFKDNSFDYVLCDPPYSNELSKKLYGTGKLKWSSWTTEAVRVCRVGGMVALYHWHMSPRPRGTSYHEIKVIITRIKHFARICCIFKKSPWG
ncbi:MAG: hypothetical protein V3U97_05450 [bacterium]